MKIESIIHRTLRPGFRFLPGPCIYAKGRRQIKNVLKLGQIIFHKGFGSQRKSRVSEIYDDNKKATSYDIKIKGCTYMLERCENVWYVINTCYIDPCINLHTELIDSKSSEIPQIVSDIEKSHIEPLITRDAWIAEADQIKSLCGEHTIESLTKHMSQEIQKEIEQEAIIRKPIDE